ncbi:MAG: hypothetical protein ACT4PV_06195 [Planctomycetaceae bacterium]
MRILLAVGGLSALLLFAGCGNCNPIGTSPGEVLQRCPGVDIVFLMDTSGSMGDEAAALCTELSGVSAQLAALGLTDFRVTILGITENAEEAGPDYSCLSNSALALLGDTIPGSPAPGHETLNSSEDWAPGTSVVAARFSWLAGRLRIIVPISDEAPENGGGSCDESDQLAIDNAISVANTNSAIVSPIVADAGAVDPCITALANQLAAATGGTVSFSNEPGADFAQIIFDLVVAACTPI